MTRDSLRIVALLVGLVLGGGLGASISLSYLTKRFEEREEAALEQYRHHYRGAVARVTEEYEKVSAEVSVMNVRVSTVCPLVLDSAAVRLSRSREMSARDFDVWAEQAGICHQAIRDTSNMPPMRLDLDQLIDAYDGILSDVQKAR